MNLTSLKSRTILLFLVSSFIIFGLLLSYIATRSYSMTEVKITQNINAELDNITMQLDNYFGTLLTQLEVLKTAEKSIPVDEFYQDRVAGNILEFMNRYDYIDSCYIAYSKPAVQELIGRDYLGIGGLRQQGKAFILPYPAWNFPDSPTYDPTKTSLDYHNPDFYSYYDFLNKDIKWRDIVYGVKTETFSAAIDLPILNPNGSVKSVLALTVNVKELNSIVESFSLGDYSTNLLFHNISERVVSFPEDITAVTEEMRFDDLDIIDKYDLDDDLENITSSENFTTISRDRESGKRMLISCRTLDVNGWRFVTITELGPFFKELYSFITVLIILSILSLLLIMFVSYRVSNNITKPIISSIDIALKISEGDMTAELPKKILSREDEIGQLAKSLKSMNKKLHEVVNDVVNGSQQIASASSQLASGNQDLSIRTEQQATILEETSAAIEEMNASIRSNADITKSANNLSNEVSVKADEGSLSVEKMISSMNEISESSNRITNIIEVINNIAFQTNLLALNASIEAARAGEKGKGFAVVAVEVRKLAKRSDNASKEIADIIKNSNQKVLEGVEVANTAGEMLVEINRSVKKVNTFIGEISASSQEQLTSVDQIDQTLSSLDENTQKNAALVEEAAASTEELSSQADELSNQMRFFKLKTEKQNPESYIMLEH